MVTRRTSCKSTDFFTDKDFLANYERRQFIAQPGYLLTSHREGIDVIPTSISNYLNEKWYRLAIAIILLPFLLLSSFFSVHDFFLFICIIFKIIIEIELVAI